MKSIIVRSNQVITMVDGSTWKPSTGRDIIHCASCLNQVDTPEEVASYPNGNCPDCGSPWLGTESKSTVIQVTVPESITGGVD